mgnify:CR=1 FL=1
MAKNRDYTGIQTYEELEATLRSVQGQLRKNRFSQQMNNLLAERKTPVRKKTFNWTDVALFVLGRVKKRLS